MTHRDRENEVAFCAEVKSWADALFARHPDWPFRGAHIEQYGRGTNKRQDLRILDREHRSPILSGEVKMPGTAEGRSPYDPPLMQDAFNKADNIQAKYFFTWNVNTFVLFDRSRWDRPMIDRRVKEYDLGLRLTSSGDCRRPEVQAEIRDKFLPKFFAEFAQIVSGALLDWGMAPDVLFLRSLESHLDWPLIGTRDYLAMQSAQDKAFAARLQGWMAGEMQWTFDPSDPENWREALDRAARTLCYVFSNRAIFYKAVQARFHESLKPLAMPSAKLGPSLIYKHFRLFFEAAVKATGDYEPVFYPDIDDWAGSLIFADPMACQGWKGFFVSLDEYDFRKVPSDILGGIFQKLISPEERQRFGQFFTHQDIVDVINAFCIRRAGDVVLDPACGSGSFLVRAYHRKAWLSGQASGGRRRQDGPKAHQELLREIYGCDIALFPAHLATLNLAARQIADEENFPLIRRGNFFEVAETPDKFCWIPGPRSAEDRQPRPVALAELDAVVGNPPYVRQELIDRRSQLKKGRDESRDAFESRKKNTKEFFQELLARMWPGLELSGRADLHCYFWPIAARFLKEGGYFGFLTSSSWLDVEYGFALQGWILQNFKLIAVLESVDEPWFADARIKTAATILQRCSDKAARDANRVRFVRLQKPLGEILGERTAEDEGARQDATERLRRLIETSEGFEDDNLRIIAVPQSQLWKEGVEAGRLLARTGAAPTETAGEDEEDDESEAQEEAVKEWNGHADHYVAGKWGRFLRAPDIYFRIMRDHGRRFVKLGEIAEIRFGIKSGCDAFFMPRDVTEEVLAEVRKGLPWNNVGLLAPAKLAEVESGKVRIVRAGDNTLHPIEAEYLRPEVHSLMQVDRPVVRAADTDRVVLWVNKGFRDLAGTYVAKYIRWGAKQTFASKKSKAVPVPERSTCAGREPWYDLTRTETGTAFWPMASQYRHFIPANPDLLVCNHRMFYLNASALTRSEDEVLTAVLNSTFVAFFKTFYGRYTGTEGSLDTEVLDVNLMEVPDVRGVSEALSRRILDAFGRMQARPTQPLVEADFMQCHTVEHVKQLAQRPVGLSDELRQPDRRALDDAVLEMIGVADPKDRARILDELLLETARHYRQVRIVEVQKQVQRASAHRRLTPEDIAASIWDSLVDAEKGRPLADWLKTLKGERQPVSIPDGKAKALGKGHMFSPAGVDFAQGKTVHHETYANPAQAALVALLANLEIRGTIDLPVGEADCAGWQRAIERRLADARSRLDALAGSRTGTQSLRAAAAGLLLQWFLHGKSK
ncbi:MAG: class I SAM-dependent DNA methyltransferase [Phycisphaerae bacterium]